MGEEENISFYVKGISGKEFFTPFGINTLAKQRILDKFGLALINKKRKELCRHCQIAIGCYLFPINLNGNDCPYYNKERTLF